MRAVNERDFGKDHWSLLAYVETRCVDNNGELDFRHLRSNPERHPRAGGRLLSSGQHWDPEYSTIIKGESQVAGHDDFDCLEDLEKAGLVEIVSVVNGFVRLTDKGFDQAAALRKHRAAGGKYAEFNA